MQKKFYDLWSNRLSVKEATELRKLIDSRPDVREAYERCVAEFQSQKHLKKGSSAGSEVAFGNGFKGKSISRQNLLIGALIVVPPCIFCILLFFIDQKVLHNGMVITAEFLSSLYGTLIIGFFFIYGIRLLLKLQIRIGVAALSIAFGFYLIRTGLGIYIFGVAPGFTGDFSVFGIHSDASATNQALSGIHSSLDTGSSKNEGQGTSTTEIGKENTADTQEVFWTPGINLDIRSYDDTAQFVQSASSSMQPVFSEPTSAIGITIDKYSYSNVRKFLQNHQLPPKEAVRIEELINYFPYLNQLETTSPPSAGPFLTSFEVAPSPFHNDHFILKIDVKPKDTKSTITEGSNLIFVVDGGTFQDQPEMLPLFQFSLRALAETLSDKDKIAIINYNGTTECDLPFTNGSEQAKILSSINALGSISQKQNPIGIERAFVEAEQYANDNVTTRIVLVTDGNIYFENPSIHELSTLINHNSKGNLTFSVVGLGIDRSLDRYMKVLAHAGKGDFYHIDTLPEGKDVFVTKLFKPSVLIEKNVRIETAFNSREVLEYRLIGYESDGGQATTGIHEEGGEVLSNMTVTALYELRLASVPTDLSKLEALGSLKIHSKASDNAITKEYSYSIEASSIKSPLEKASNDFRFAVAVAGFGEILRGGEEGNSMNLSEVRKLAIDSKDKDPFGYRAEFIHLVDATAALLPGSSHK